MAMKDRTLSTMHTRSQETSGKDHRMRGIIEVDLSGKISIT